MVLQISGDIKHGLLFVQFCIGRLPAYFHHFNSMDYICIKHSFWRCHNYYTDILPVDSCYIYWNHDQQKKVLLCKCKRHTARCVVSTHSVVLSPADPPPLPAGWPPPPPAGLTPRLDWPPPAGLTPPPPGWTDPSPPQVWTDWKHYLPHPSDAGGKKTIYAVALPSFSNHNLVSCFTQYGFRVGGWYWSLLLNIMSI